MNISLDDTLEWRREYYVNEIRNKRIEILMELIKDISWSLGWSHINGDKIRNFLENKKRIPKNSKKQ